MNNQHRTVNCREVCFDFFAPGPAVPRCIFALQLTQQSVFNHLIFLHIMRHISYAAMARILQSAVAECTIVTPIRYIIQYAETMSTDGIPDNILGREDIKRYMAMIDLAAERSSRARAAARRRAAMRSSQSPTGPDSTCSDSSCSDSSASNSNSNPNLSPNSSDSNNTNSCTSYTNIKVHRSVSVSRHMPRNVQLGSKLIKARSTRPRPRFRLQSGRRTHHTCQTCR